MREALIIVDMQVGFMNEHTEHLEDKIAEFVNKYKRRFESIIATKYINHENTACYKFEKYDKCMLHTPEVYLVPKIAHRATNTFDKDRYSCWNEGLKSYLRIIGVDRVYFCGVNTGCCVLHSVFDAYNDVFDCSVISDLCGSSSGEASHLAALQVLRECITSDRVITTEYFEKK